MIQLNPLDESFPDDSGNVIDELDPPYRIARISSTCNSNIEDRGPKQRDEISSDDSAASVLNLNDHIKRIEGVTNSLSIEVNGNLKTEISFGTDDDVSPKTDDLVYYSPLTSPSNEFKETTVTKFISRISFRLFGTRHRPYDHIDQGDQYATSPSARLPATSVLLQETRQASSLTV